MEFKQNFKYLFCAGVQWRTQSDNLIPLWKFETLSLLISIEIDYFLQSTNTQNLHSGTKQSGYATVSVVLSAKMNVYSLILVL